MSITERSAELQRTLDQIYSSPKTHTKHIIELYRALYNIPTLEHSYKINQDGFNLFTKFQSFVNVAAFNQEGKILILREGSKPRENYHFPGDRILGKQVESDASFCIEETANEIVEFSCGTTIAELIPLAIIKNVFVCDDKTHTHTGVAFAGHLSGEFTNPRNLKHEFVDAPNGPMIYQNAEICDLARRAIDRRDFAPDLEEVDAHKRGFFQRTLHNFLIKPITYHLASDRIRRSVLSAVGENARSIIDVSAGDDRTIVDVCHKKEPDVAVANDISWNSMRKLMMEASKRKFYMIFSNHNASSLKFNMKFDVAICKNTLHHVDSPEEMKSLLSALERTADRVIIVDIEEPRRTLRGSVWNWYYENIFGDAGHHHNFLTQSRFRRLISCFFDGRYIEYSNIETIKGRYLMAVVDR